MPLRDDVKDRMQDFAKLVGQSPEAAVKGPVFLVDQMLKAQDNENLRCRFGDDVHALMVEFNQNIRDNRQEAEQYLAGLLGMM